MLKSLVILLIFQFIVMINANRISVYFSNPGTKPWALYYVGEDSTTERLNTEMPWFGNSDVENLIAVLDPNNEASENVSAGSAFTRRCFQSSCSPCYMLYHIVWNLKVLTSISFFFIFFKCVRLIL